MCFYDNLLNLSEEAHGSDTANLRGLRESMVGLDITVAPATLG